jgi:hypothetical protein
MQLINQFIILTGVSIIQVVTLTQQESIPPHGQQIANGCLHPTNRYKTLQHLNFAAIILIKQTKVDVPDSIFQFWTPIFEWCMVGCES